MLVGAVIVKMEEEKLVENLTCENSRLKEENAALVLQVELKSAEIDCQNDIIKEMELEIETLRKSEALTVSPQSPIFVSSDSVRLTRQTISNRVNLSSSGSGGSLKFCSPSIFYATPSSYCSYGKPPLPPKSTSKGQLVNSVLSFNLLDDLACSGEEPIGEKDMEQSLVLVDEKTQRRYYVNESIPTYVLELMNGKKMFRGFG